MIPRQLATISDRHTAPLAVRIDAAHLLAEAVASAGTLVQEDAMQILLTVVPALLLMGPSTDEEEFGEACVSLLHAVLHASGAGTLTGKMLYAADRHLGAASLGIQHPTFGLISLLALALEMDRTSASQTFPECRQIIATLLRCMEAVGPNGGGDGSTLATCIFTRLLQAHKASPATMLALCNMDVGQILRLLPGTAREQSFRPLHTSPSIEMLELLAELAADAALSSALLVPAVLGTLKPPLLSGCPTTQLGTVDVLVALHSTAGTSAVRVLVAEDFVSFLVELCRKDVHAEVHASQPECADRLRCSVRVLLKELLAYPQPASGPLCSRLVDALSTRVPSHMAKVRRIGALTSSMERAMILQEAQCVCSLLGWYSPIAPRETSRLVRFFEHTLLTLIPSPASMAQLQVTTQHDGEGIGDEALETMRALRTASSLARAVVTGSARAADTVALRTLLKLFADELIGQILSSQPVALETSVAPLDALRVQVDIVCAFTTLLDFTTQVPVAVRRTFANQLAPVMLSVIARMNDASVPTHAAVDADRALHVHGGMGLPAAALLCDVQVELERSASELAVALLDALGRLPESDQDRPRVSLPTGVDECIRSLLSGTSSVAHHELDLQPLCHLEWLLLHLQHGCAVDAALTGLATFLSTLGTRLHVILPPSTLRRLASVWTLMRPCTPAFEGGGDSLDECAGHAIAMAIAQSPAKQPCAMPATTLAWLIGQVDAADAEMGSNLVLHWATQPLGTDAGSNGEAEVKANEDPVYGRSRTTLVEACRGRPHAARVLVRLLSRHLHVTQAMDNGMLSVLQLVAACADDDRAGTSYDDRPGTSSSKAASPSEALAVLASEGLINALGSLFMLLPTSGAGKDTMSLRVVLRLMTALMRGEHLSCEQTAACAAEAQSAAHHVASALLRDATASKADHQLRLELLNFLNVSLALNGETVDAVGGNLPLVELLADLATKCVYEQPFKAAGVGAIPPGCALSEQSASAACLVLTQLVRRLALEAVGTAATAAGPPKTSLHRAILDGLCSRLTLTALLPGLRSSSHIRCAASLHLVAVLCDSGVLWPPTTALAQIPEQSRMAPSSSADSPQRAVEPSESGLLRPSTHHRQPGSPNLADDVPDPDVEAWGAGLQCALLNLAVRSEELVLSALYQACFALHSSRATGLRTVFERLAHHPWQSFILEIAITQRHTLPPALCGLWSLILGRRPAWSHSLALRKPHLVKELVARLLHASPFGAEQLALLSSLHDIAALGPKLTADALRLIQFRAREPTAIRWQNACAEALALDVKLHGDEMMATHSAPNKGARDEWFGRHEDGACGRFLVLGGMISPVGLLYSLPSLLPAPDGAASHLRSANGHQLPSKLSAQCGGSHPTETEAALLNRAEGILSTVSQSGLLSQATAA